MNGRVRKKYVGCCYEGGEGERWRWAKCNMIRGVRVETGGVRGAARISTCGAVLKGRA